MMRTVIFASAKYFFLSVVIAVFLAGSAFGWGKPLGDLNEDCSVNWLDIDILVNQWLEADCPVGHCADLDGVSGIDFADLALLAKNWRKTCTDVTLVINELQADNEATIADPQGDYDDWIEIYNNSPVAADVGGLYVTDDLNVPGKWHIPDNTPSQTAIEPYGFLLLWADNDVNDGAAHLGFSLNADGEQAALVRFNGTTVIDSVTFGTQDNDQSYGRYPDAENNWELFGIPTPAADNVNYDPTRSARSEQGDCVVVFNEIMYNNPENDITLEWVELHNQMAVNIDLSGWEITDGIHYHFPEGTVIPGWGYLVVASSPNDLQAETGYSGALGPYAGRLSNGGEKIRLRDNSDRVMDALLYDDEGDWNSVPDGNGYTLAKIDPNSATWPAENWKASSQINGTPGADNGLAGSVAIPTASHTAGSIVINEIMYNHQPIWETDSTPYQNSNEEWIEFYNRSGSLVSLTGWRLADAVDFNFPSGKSIPAGGYLVVSGDANALKAKYPAVASNIIGDFAGKLANGNDRIRLYNNTGVLVDEVKYYDGKPWPQYADGGGSSLELKDPNADNTKPDAWADSNEAQKAGWKTYTYQDVAVASVGPDSQWKEFIMGLLDAGEILIDDVNVLEDPCGTKVQFIQNGTFEPNEAHWRLGGNHSPSHVDIDPCNPAGRVLHLVATGQAEHIYNHAETTIAGGRQVTNGKLYKVSFRAKWLAGNPRLNTRLYFNRVPKTFVIEPNQFNGTPAAKNSCWQSNIGPTYNYLAHSPVVPNAGQTVTVSTVVKDSDSISSVKLYYRIAAGSWSNKDMANQGSGLYTATITGQAAKTIVQFYIQATDSRGATSTYPAAGANSRALYKVNDSKAELTTGLHNFRIIMTEGDFIDLNAITNAYTDLLYGATVIYDEKQAFYDVGVCFKGSLGTRANPDIYRKGYKVEFNADNLFRGVTDSLTIDRASSSGCNFVTDCDPEHRTREILFKHILNVIGGISTQYDDLCRFIPPDSNGANHAQLQIGHYGNRYLDSYYEDGSDGMIFKHELVYYPQSTTDGNLESPKKHDSGTAYYPSPPISNLGDSADNYRHIYFVRNNRDKDDYNRIIEMGHLFDLTGSAFVTQAEQMLDLDEWMRAYAWTSIISSFDNYFGSNTPHNHFWFVRPSDNKICFLPWDNDFVYEFPQWDPGGLDLKMCTQLNSRLFQDPNDRRYKRLYYGHINDILTTIVNADYLTDWAQHFGSLIPEEDYVNYYLDFQLDRANWILTTQFPSQAPYVSFEITTNGGNNFTTTSPSVTIEGNGWIDIRTIEVAGFNPQPSFWWLDPPDPAPDMTRWQTTVTLNPGANILEFIAYDYQGNVSASDSITVTRQ